MAAPNIVGITTLVGITTFLANAGTTASTFLSNPANSGRVLRIISFMASNKTASSVTVTALYRSQAAGAGTSISLVQGVTVPSGSTLIIVGRDTPLYLEEDRSITVSASAATSIDFISSYETIG